MEAAAEDVLGLGLSAGFKFEPDDDELVEHFLLRQIQDRQLPFEGVILVDDPLRAPPWELLDDHERGDEAFFFANGQAIHGKGSRQRRTCVGGCWEGQKVCVDGERLRIDDVDDDSRKEIAWRKYMLNFHAEDEDGSKGWVMHEYSITAPADLAASPLRLYRIRFSGHGKNRKRGPDDYCRGGARAAKRQARADAEPGLLEEHISAANSVFPTVAVVDIVADEDGGSTWPAATSYSDQAYQYQYQGPQLDSFQDLVVADSSFLPAADVGEYEGPAAASSHQDFGWNTTNLPTHGVMNEYDRVAEAEADAEAAAGMPLPPFRQGSFSGAIDESPPFMNFELPDQNFNIDESPFMNFELPDYQNFNIDEFLVFPDQCGLEAPLHDHYSSAGMQTQSSVQLMHARPQDG